jgi:hypothetical protein
LLRRRDAQRIRLADFKRLGVGDFHQGELKSADGAAFAIAADVPGHQGHGPPFGYQLVTLMDLLRVNGHTDEFVLHVSLCGLAAC